DIAPPAAAPFQVVLVCTGNRSRSPLLEHFLRDPLQGRSVQIRSVGTKDVGPRPALVESIAAGASLGVDLSDHVSQPIGWRGLRDADLVIGFERMHVERAVRDGAAVPERCFMLVELVTILERIDPAVERGAADTARALVARAHKERGLLTPEEASQEVPDPLGEPEELHREVARTLAGLGRRLALALFGPPPLPPENVTGADATR
ncbi:MAG TPA: hypothetical protein VFS18_02900, partial [Actinomycetota bacterium]|nr:hypothetical protein [Actinomycetota bacterium]